MGEAPASFLRQLGAFIASDPGPPGFNNLQHLNRGIKPHLAVMEREYASALESLQRRWGLPVDVQVRGAVATLTLPSERSALLGGEVLSSVSGVDAVRLYFPLTMTKLELDAWVAQKLAPETRA